MAKKILFAALLIVGIAGFFAVPAIVGVEKTLDAVGQVGVICIVAYVLNASLVMIMPAIGWWILMRAADMKVTLADALRASFMAFPINFLTPSAYLGGEPVKALYISNKYGIPASRVLGTLIVGKFQEVAGIILLMLLSGAGVIFYTDLVTTRDEVAMGIALGAILVLFSAFILAYATNFKPITRVVSLFALGRTPRRKLANFLHSCEITDQTIHDAFIKRWKSFLLSGGIAMLSAASVLFRLPLFVYFDPEPARFALSHVFLVFIVTNVVNLFQIVPGSLGVFDGTMLLLFSETGLPEESAAAYAVVGRIADIVLFVFGLWLLAHYGLSKYIKPQAKAELKRAQTEAFIVGEDGVKRPRK
jgi:uncharacterized protein (TIRG00374 family)